MMNKNKWTLLLTLISFNSVDASTFNFISTEAQINYSDYVIYGEVISKKTKPHTFKSTAYTVENKVKKYLDYEFDSVLTIFELRIIEVLKGGTEQNIIEVAVAGGCFDGRCVEYSHSYDYEIKDNALLFLIKNEDAYYITSNGSYDAFIVKENNEISRKTESVIYPFEQSMLENFHLESEMSLEKLKSLIELN